MEDETKLGKAKKSAYSFLRAIGLGKNKNDKPDKNVFYGGNVVSAANKKKKQLEQLDK